MNLSTISEPADVLVILQATFTDSSTALGHA